MKPWWQSKTVITGTAELLTGLGSLISGWSPEVGWGGLAVGILTIILRIMTKQPVTK